MVHRLLLITVITFSFIAIVVAGFWVTDRFFSQPTSNIKYGLTFSTYYSRSLGLQPPELYRAVIEDLKVKKIRLPVYWNAVETTPGHFDFREIDELLKITPPETQIILAIGYKVPRWPECFPPPWVQGLSREGKQAEVLQMLHQTVNHFKGIPQIKAWQVENEPELAFGPCELLPSSFLKDETGLVRSLDTRPIITTDSGELTLWMGALKFADKMGISMYRRVYDKNLGYISYPIPPLFYRFKTALLPKLWAGKTKEIIVSELQTEPWMSKGSPLNTPLEEQISGFSLKNFRDTLAYASRTGFSEQYLWGVEWWYWMKTQGHPEYWNFAKTLIFSDLI